MGLEVLVSLSSGHNSEYNSWFRRRSDLIEKYCTNGTGWNPGVYAYILNEYLNRENDWQQGTEEWLSEDRVDLKRDHEYSVIKTFMSLLF